MHAVVSIGTMQNKPSDVHACAQMCLLCIHSLYITYACTLCTQARSDAAVGRTISAHQKSKIALGLNMLAVVLYIVGVALIIAFTSKGVSFSSNSSGAYSGGSYYNGGSYYYYCKYCDLYYYYASCTYGYGYSYSNKYSYYHGGYYSYYCY